MGELALADHPRLYVRAEALARLRNPATWPVLQGAARDVAALAKRYADLPPLTYARDAHNALLGRAREIQGRIVTLLVRWQQTGDRRYRNAAMAHVRQMGDWTYWSWLAMREGDDAPDAIFDLSYGENSATLAIAFDWMHDTLTTAEKEDFLRIASERPLLSGAKHARPGGAWWFGKPDSNWNTVCAGGLGMLALALAGDVAGVEDLLPLVETSIEPFVRHLEATEGGWPEGIGYWNYGMRYAFMYLLSYENATESSHSLLGLDAIRQTLAFPLDFTPYGQPCSFGDVNRWQPLPIHYAVARRVGAAHVCADLDQRIEAAAHHGIGGSSWPHAAEWLLLHPGIPEQSSAPSAEPGVRLYQGLDWGVLSDPQADPPLAVTVRGGTTAVPHGHRDLLSFHCVVGGEKLIHNLSPDEYLDTTFSPRREELFEITPASKNTILINGVGVTTGSSLDITEKVQPSGAARTFVRGGIRLVATSAMGETRDGPAAEFCARLFLLLDTHGVAIVDRVALPHPGRVESRMHTFADATPLPEGAPFGSGALLKIGDVALTVAYAATTPGLFTTAHTAPTTPSSPSATVLRWCTGDRYQTDVVLVTLLVPGKVSASVDVRQPDDANAGVANAGVGIEIETDIDGRQSAFHLCADLRPCDAIEASDV